MPDRIPVIGFSATTPNLVHAFGFSGHGFQLGPVVGEIIAELITEGRSASPLEPFAIDRFAAHAPSAQPADVGIEESSIDHRTRRCLAAAREALPWRQPFRGRRPPEDPVKGART